MQQMALLYSYKERAEGVWKILYDFFQKLLSL